MMKKLKERIPTTSLVIFLIGIICAALYILFLISPAAANFFNENISRIFRRALAYITAPLPFSLAEFIIFASPVIIFLILRAMFRYMDAHPHGFARAVSAMLSALVLLMSVFVLNFAAGYRTSSLDIKLNLENTEVDSDSLLATAEYIKSKLNELVPSVCFKDGGSIRGYSHSRTVELASSSYDKLHEQYGFIDSFRAPVKRLAVSPLMTYTHISGIYSFFTGEANLNTNYPEFVNVYTVCHEMAHQRGIARENEANFIAYLVCITSDDTYMQYCGYLNMLEYLATAINKTSPADLQKLYQTLDTRIIAELNTYSEFFEKYSKSTASKVSEKINNTYLVSQGTPGTVSYGMVVELAVAYHAENISEKVTD